LDEEEFNRAEVLFDEILAIEPNYQDVAELKTTAHFEPIYRKGKEFLNSGSYRKAYSSFDEILRKQPEYKDARELKDDALARALITIAIIDFKNLTSYQRVEINLKGSIQKELSEIKSPFYKVIDRESSSIIKNEQLLSLEGKVDGTVSAKAGKILGAKALLTGRIEEYNINSGNLIKTKKKGYLREKIIEKADGEEKSRTIYHKTEYNEFSQTESVFCRFQYQLLSAETGEILVTDALGFSESDEIHYAVFEGNKDKLVPGYWEKKDTDSPKDEINDNKSDCRALQYLLSSRQGLKNIEELKKELNSNIARMVARKIEKYDPEN